MSSTIETATSASEAPEAAELAPRFGRLTPEEAGRRSQEAQAAQRQQQEATRQGDSIRHLRVPVNVAATVRRLANEAQKGSTHASRELRAWMELLETDVPVTTSELDTRTRAALLQRLLAELEEA